ncbi:hypothetical protein JVT61DRAFT_8951 [Boletus reticuloceps]|uniref:Uncharacterized protein n=1 Tax=Boletus reticuloceps TaxID=495285 RepID=A0A8I2YHD5_9AGAM|nr:hypothetical protein JVT61DRAFT_8951 [Boletus reticuloceps]
MNAMDPVVHHNNPSQSTLSPVSSTRRRGSRENETPSQRQKREKAAERQRRKRERDRHVNNLNAAMSYPQPTEPPPPPQPQAPQPAPQTFTGQELSPEELVRKERVRAAARERQRKHRGIVKQRKMRELGLDMTSEMLPGIEEVQFRVNGQNEYQVLPPELGHPMNPQDPSFPQPPLTGGQTFASALLVSFSFAPHLKQQLFRTLSITTEDLAALEPVIADAFDQWDHQRRMHFAQQAAAAKAADGSMAGLSAPPFPDMSDSTNSFGEQASPHASEFRARFHRSLVAPSPFRNINPADSTTATTSTPTSTPGSGPPSDPIDPHLSGVVMAAGDGRQKVTVDADTESVVGRLERP